MQHNALILKFQQFDNLLFGTNFLHLIEALRDAPEWCFNGKRLHPAVSSSIPNAQFDYVVLAKAKNAVRRS
ncbi:hypothetical protein L596_013112 [Steinernema carpocapsae]|uniref:Uncharacterized protein n=1 Tax=Steinernema carpocapsae TaxID=34508 RepID=A0A4V6A503_STECR|nr:hypothetical protein L596_013112 [Steinernema carpocapsae]